MLDFYSWFHLLYVTPGDVAQIYYELICSCLYFMSLLLNFLYNLKENLIFNEIKLTGVTNLARFTIEISIFVTSKAKIEVGKGIRLIGWQQGPKLTVKHLLCLWKMVFSPATSVEQIGPGRWTKSGTVWPPDERIGQNHSQSVVSKKTLLKEEGAFAY